MSLKKFLCTLSGDDWGIIRKCSEQRQREYSAIGLFVLLIFALCFLSCCYTLVKLFQNYWTGIPAGLFFAFMVTNIYLLLLYTLTRNMIPHVETATTKVLSATVRIGFIIFIAITVAKPLEVYLFSETMHEEIADFKAGQLERYKRVSAEHLQSENLFLLDAVERDLRDSNGVETPQVAKGRELIRKHEEERLHSLQRMEVLVAQSNYFVRSVVLLNIKHPSCWLITLAIALIFLVPASLKFKIPPTAKFYEEKKRLETNLIENSYKEFKTHYSDLLKEFHQVKLEFVELFEDAPFNTKRKKDDREFKTQDALLREIYDA